MKATTKKAPVLDLGDCRNCDACLEVCPSVFLRNGNTGLIEVADLPEYPKDQVDEAIALCPEDCIAWEDMEEWMP